MSFKNLFIEHSRTNEVQEWVDEEIAEQEERYQTIVDQMDALSSSREKWYQEFFDRITTSGFNEDGDMKRKIDPADLPVKPADAEDNGNRVIWQYGIDGE